ncbi:hypothetical protein F441_20824 [Phytophthora nicotianae CJ01A1]|uniref:Uncharacterized protein n=1 Tax=Phytophthora nicotianae CJ01A1 TaxID=1317063 RepID=W2VXB3_PHYNI|nr:hypothetical protein F441_20824 [Phytophthora nicotianae CJ01A1]
MRLAYAELNEMVAGSRFGQETSDSIWNLSSGHIGMAMLMFLNAEFGPDDAVECSKIESALRSLKLLEYICRSEGGILSPEAICKMVSSENLSDDMVNTSLEDVAYGKVMLPSSAFWRTSRIEALESLTRYGFLYAEDSQHLHFSSNMHLKIWLNSNRPEPMAPSVTSLTRSDFVQVCVKRIRSSRLQMIASEDMSTVARERQLQMEIYRAITSCAPKISHQS